VKRRIRGFHRESGDWFAELDCGHDCCLTGAAPGDDGGWVHSAEARASRIGSGLDCSACQELILPARVVFTRVTPEWDEESMPAALRRSHRVRSGSWGRLLVLSGRVRFTAATSPPIEAVIGGGESQPIPPGVEHDVQPLGRVRFAVEFFAIRPWYDPGADVGGESACLAHLLCPECAAVLDGSPHRDGCSRG